MRAVNLLPQDARARKPVSRVAIAGVAGGAAVSMLLGALYLSAQSTVSDREAELTVLRAELAAIPKPKVQTSANQELAKERSGRVVAVAHALSYRVGWDRLFRELSSVLPGDVWLTELEAHGPSPAPAVTDDPATASATAAAPFTIRGFTYTQEGVARFLARLAVVPDLTGVELETSARQKLEGQQVYQFTINAEVRPTGATS